MKTNEDSFLAFSCLLIMLVTSSFLLQLVGFWIDVPLVHYALPIAFLPCLWLTYGYFFQPSRSALIVGIILAAILAVLGFISAHILDFAMDGMSYHQPGSDLILHGWNPVREDTKLFWVKILTFGAWAARASLASLYGSIDAAKMLNIWWIFIALPIVIAGIRTQFGPLRPHHYLLALLLILNPVVIGQVMTHLIDVLIYLEGITFIGALMMYGQCPRRNKLSILLMGASLLFMINTKFMGIYWGVTLCTGAIIYRFCELRQFPWKLAMYLFITGVVSTVVIGYQPYVANFLRYGAMLPWDTDIGYYAFRPDNLNALPKPLRLFYSIFSISGGDFVKDAVLKFPWVIKDSEWHVGHAGPVNAGFGPLFALGSLLSLALFFWNVFKQKIPFHKGILCLAITLLVFAAAFPENWWARYVPFTYAVPILLLLASARPNYSLYLVCIVFAANSFIPGRATFNIILYEKNIFEKTIETLHKTSPRSIYLVSMYGPLYETMNHGYIAIQRRLHDHGIEITAVKGSGPCPNKAISLAEFDLCYE